MKNILTTAIYIAGMILVWNILSIPSEAGYKEDSMNNIYYQLTQNGVNSASTEYNTTDIPTIKEFEQYVSDIEDDPDDLFDGEMIFTRGYITTLWKDGIFNVTLENSYNINEADELTDTMAREIKSALRESASQRQVMAAICNYIANTYDYDTQAAEAENNNNYGSRQNFVEAYYGDRKILCTDYAALTYLLANKLGIECELMFGKNHVYNIVRFNNTDRWIGYDLAGGSRYAQITAYDYLINDLYKLNDSSESAEKARILNNGRTYDFANPIDIAYDVVYFAIDSHHIPEILLTGFILAAIITAIISSCAKKTTKSHKNKRNQLARA